MDFSRTWIIKSTINVRYNKTREIVSLAWRVPKDTFIPGDLVKINTRPWSGIGIVANVSGFSDFDSITLKNLKGNFQNASPGYGFISLIKEAEKMTDADKTANQIPTTIQLENMPLLSEEWLLTFPWRWMYSVYGFFTPNNLPTGDPTDLQNANLALKVKNIGMRAEKANSVDFKEKVDYPNNLFEVRPTSAGTEHKIQTLQPNGVWKYLKQLSANHPFTYSIVKAPASPSKIKEVLEISPANLARAKEAFGEITELKFLPFEMYVKQEFSIQEIANSINANTSVRHHIEFTPELCKLITTAKLEDYLRYFRNNILKSVGRIKEISEISIVNISDELEARKTTTSFIDKDKPPTLPVSKKKPTTEQESDNSADPDTPSDQQGNSEKETDSKDSTTGNSSDTNDWQDNGSSGGKMPVSYTGQQSTKRITAFGFSIQNVIVFLLVTILAIRILNK